MSLGAAPVHRANRRPAESEESTLFDVPYPDPQSQQTQSRPLTGASPAAGPSVISTTSEKDGFLASSSWLVEDRLLAKGKTEKSRRAAEDGPFVRLGGGLECISRKESWILAGVALLALIVRLWRIDRPSSVVFDEVHFGGFATKYIKNRFFMDVHPPLAKLLITAASAIFNFSGNFDFKEIGKEYGPLNVPYIPMRLVGGLFGVALVPISYLTMRIMSLSTISALLVSLMLTFENGLITQSRLILLDSPLVFFCGFTAFCFQGFTAENAYRPFTRRWWSWLAATGLSMGATLSVKWVGLFTVATIGVATVLQLWELLGDLKLSMPTIFRHFVARAIGLIILPMLFYMAMFEIHFMVLTGSGDGDAFMSSEFQHSLKGHGMKDTFADVMVGSDISIRHLNTQGGYLHSHPHSYPSGSKQQQITLYPHRDDNNVWHVQNATKDYHFDPMTDLPTHPITDHMKIRLNHTISSKMLHSHDHRPPISEVDWQNEVSAYGFKGFDGDANDQWVIEFLPDYSTGSKAKKQLQAINTKFRLKHMMSGCYLFSHKVKLPEWGYGQQEVTCNKNPSLPNSIWFIETNTHPMLDAKSPKINYRKPGFLSRFLELNKVMWRTNKGLTDRHSYDSRPEHWPWLRRGINFWVKGHRQVYLMGNPVVWWSSSLAVLAYAVVRGFLILRSKRGYQDFTNTNIVYYERVCTFVAMGWALHYLPFFIMGRQLFLHHYFPALYYSILMLGAVFDASTFKLKPKTRVQVAGVLLLMTIWAWQHWAPLAYAGEWTKKECKKAQWLKTWDFSCADFPQDYSRYDKAQSTTVGFKNTTGAHTETTAAPVIEPGRNMFEDKFIEKKPDTTGPNEAPMEPPLEEYHEEAPKDPAVDPNTVPVDEHEADENAAPIPQNEPAGTKNAAPEELPLDVLEALEAAQAQEARQEEGQQQKQKEEVADQEHAAEHHPPHEEAPIFKDQNLEDAPVEILAEEPEHVEADDQEREPVGNLEDAKIDVEVDGADAEGDEEGAA